MKNRMLASANISFSEMPYQVLGSVSIPPNTPQTVSEIFTNKKGIRCILKHLFHKNEKVSK
jgi:hypothetical protein